MRHDYRNDKRMRPTYHKNFVHDRKIGAVHFHTVKFVAQSQPFKTVAWHG